MEINYIINKDELIDYKLRNYRHTGKYIITTLIIYIILLALYFIYYKLYGSNIIKFAIYLLFVIVMLILFKKKVLYYFRKQELEIKYNLSEFNYLFKEIKILLNDENITMYTNFGERIIKRNSIKSIYDLSEYIYLYTTTDQVVEIPTYAFLNESEKSKFIEWFLKNKKLKIGKKYPII